MVNVNCSSYLPIELLMRIVENHLSSVDDIVAFSCVCASWNRAVRSCNKLLLIENGLSQIPWLMLTDGNDDELYEMHTHEFYRNINVYYVEVDEDELHRAKNDKNDLLVDSDYYSNINDGNRKVLNLSHNRNKCYNLNLPEIYGKGCWGSRYGWIVTLGLNRKMHLFNCLTKSRLPLPSQTTFRYPWKPVTDETIRLLFLTKVVVLRVPQDDDNNKVPWLVVALNCRSSPAAIARPGYASWMHIEDYHQTFMDVIYCNKMKWLLFVHSDGGLFYYDINNNDQQPRAKLYLKGPKDIHCSPDDDGPLTALIYLVQCCDDLLIIARYKDGDRAICYKTLYFRIFRISLPTRSWEELHDLGNVSLFVGRNETMCVNALDAGCRRNCIYFCDDGTSEFFDDMENIRGHDSGVFDLGNKKIESIYDSNDYKSSYCPPFWFSPTMF